MNFAAGRRETGARRMFLENWIAKAKRRRKTFGEAERGNPGRGAGGSNKQYDPKWIS